MWNSFLGEVKSPGKLLQKIGDAVAPPVDSDDEEYDSTSDEDYDEEYEEEYYEDMEGEEGSDDFEVEPAAAAAPNNGFASQLAQAMDSETSYDAAGSLGEEELKKSAYLLESRKVSDAASRLEPRQNMIVSGRNEDYDEEDEEEVLLEYVSPATVSAMDPKEHLFETEKVPSKLKSSSPVVKNESSTPKKQELITEQAVKALTQQMPPVPPSGGGAGVTSVLPLPSSTRPEKKKAVETKELERKTGETTSVAGTRKGPPPQKKIEVSDKSFPPGLVKQNSTTEKSNRIIPKAPAASPSSSRRGSAEPNAKVNNVSLDSRQQPQGIQANSPRVKTAAATPAASRKEESSTQATVNAATAHRPTPPNKVRPRPPASKRQVGATPASPEPTQNITTAGSESTRRPQKQQQQQRKQQQQQQQVKREIQAKKSTPSTKTVVDKKNSTPTSNGSVKKAAPPQKELAAVSSRISSPDGITRNAVEVLDVSPVRPPPKSTPPTIRSMRNERTPSASSATPDNSTRSGSTPPSSKSSALKCDASAAAATSMPRTRSEGSTNYNANQSLQARLAEAEKMVKKLKVEAAERDEQERKNQQRQAEEMAERQAQALAATAEQYEGEMGDLRKKLHLENQQLTEQLEQERNVSAQREAQWERLLDEAEKRAAAAENEKSAALSRQDSENAEILLRQQRAVQSSQDELTKTLTQLDEKENQIRQLQTVIADMRQLMKKNQDGAEEVEEEIIELHSHNEELEQRVEQMEKEASKREKVIAKLQSDADKISGLQMELHMLKEARDRDQAKIQSATESASSSLMKVTEERHEALAEARDLESQLAAAHADLSVAQADAERAMMASANLQQALEAIQSERETEAQILEDQRMVAEEAMAKAHAAALEATHEAHDAELRQVRMAADASVKNVMNEVKTLEHTIEQYRKEGMNLRRSLDEALFRLQSTQEDVIDRALMKNIFLDWTSKHGKAKKDVLELLASVLHFTEEEKEKVGVGELPGTLGKVVGAVAAPLPPSAVNVNKLEGHSVREKWVNFLLAETEGESATTQTQISGAETRNGN